MKVTVKTIDSGSKEFELSDNTTVLKLKDEILKQMAIPLHQQRLIFQGKVLKDEKTLKEYGVEDKVLHLVKRPPPSSSKATPTTTTTEDQPTPPLGEVNTTQDLLFVGTGMPSQSELAQVTQNIVDSIVDSLSSQGTDARVTAETVTTDSSGRIHTASLSARSEVSVSTDINPTTTSTATSHQQPTSARESIENFPQQSPQQPLESPPKPPSTISLSSATPLEEATETVEEDVEEDAEAREAERQRIIKINRHENHTIYTHARTVKRCFDFANRVMDRYDRGSVRVKAKIAQEKMDGTAEPMETDVALESMDVLEASSAPPGSGAEREVDDRYAALRDPDMPDFKASLLSVMMDDLEAVQRRLRPLIVQYQEMAVADREFTEAESVLAAQVAITVRDVIYYIGHGYVSLSRLHINFLIPPPRMLHLAAPHKTEMRRVMLSMRRCFPTMMPPIEEPSGYIVDISQDGSGPGGSQASGATTRAVVNKGKLDVSGGLPGFAGMFGPMLGGVIDGGRPAEPSSAQGGREGTKPRSTAGTGTHTTMAADNRKKNEGEIMTVDMLEDEVKAKEPGAAGKAAEKLVNEDVSRMSEEEIKKREKRAKRMEVQLAMTIAAEKHAFKRNEDDIRRSEESKKRLAEEAKEREEKKAKEEERRKATGANDGGASNTPKGVSSNTPNEVASKAPKEVVSSAPKEAASSAPKEVASNAPKEVSSNAPKEVSSNTSNEVSSKAPKEVASNASEASSSTSNETPLYLARLISELITGVADPAGPHRPSQDEALDNKETPSGEAMVSNSTKATSEKKADGNDTEAPGENKDDGEDNSQLSFAERYAGPKGTTVTIAAAPSAQFGFRMEGPSLSIKNPGTGAEPEMTINFPVPPAMHLLQQILYRAKERHRERQANGESSASSTSDEDVSDEGDVGARDAPKPKKKKRSRPKVPRPFLPEDGRVGSTDEAGDLDSMSTDKEGPVDFNDTATIAGEHMTMLEAMAEVRGKLRVERDSDEDEENPRSVSLFEKLLRIISRELKVGEVFKILQGDVSSLERTQSDFLEFIKEKLLDGAKPTKENGEQACSLFLQHFRPSIEAILPTLPIRDPGIDFIETTWKLFYYLTEQSYDYIIDPCSLRQQRNHVFAKKMQALARKGTQLFACIMRHCVDADYIFDDLVGKMVSKLFPPSTPTVIINVCIESVLKWLYKARQEATYVPMELDRYVMWKPGVKAIPNHSYTLHMFAKDGIPYNTKLKLPYPPPEESCPGGEAACSDYVNRAPPGVPEEWVSAIDHDSETHPRREGPQQPYSEAYLSGMPAKRRKQLDIGEPCTIISDNLAYDAMEAALLRSGVETYSGASDIQMLSLVHQNCVISGSVSAEVHACHRERLNDAGVDKQQYPNAMEFYHLDPEKLEDRLDN